MCGRFSVYVEGELLAERFGAELPEQGLTPTYNAAPSQLLPVILGSSPEQIELAQWGYLLSWARASTKFRPQINARAEGIESKSMFRSAFAKRHCLVLADGFYEWSRKGKTKVPHRIALHNDEPFAFAGIWESHKTPRGEKVASFAIITTEANELVHKIHDRMPVILRPEDEQEWLEVTEDLDLQKSLLSPYSQEEMVMYPVTTAVNRPSFNNPNAIRPAHERL